MTTPYRYMTLIDATPNVRFSHGSNARSKPAAFEEARRLFRAAFPPASCEVLSVRVVDLNSHAGQAFDAVAARSREIDRACAIFDGARRTLESLH